MMNLNQIQLNDHLLTQLYGDVLIAPGAPQPAVMQKPDCLGENKKKILILVSHKHVPVIPDQDLQFLTTVLTACKLGIEDVAIVNITRTTMEAISAHLEFNHVLLFGIGPLTIGLPMNFPPFQVQQFDKKTYLTTPALQEIEMDKSIKQKFWLSLKELFSI